MDVQEQQSSYLALQIFLDQELPNYTLITYTNGLAYLQKSSVIGTPISHLISEKRLQRSWGSNRTCPPCFTHKWMDYQNERTSGWSNICTLSQPCIPKIGPTGSLFHWQYTTTESTQPWAYLPIKSSLVTLHTSLHQK